MRVRSIGRAAGALALAAILPATTAGAATADASAAALNWHVQFHSGGYSSASAKWAYAQCPDGFQVVGGGGAVLDVTGRAGLTGLWPDLSRNRFYARATETAGGTSQDWRVQAQAVCVQGADLGLHQVFSGAALSRADGTASRSVACPQGERLFGAGAQVSSVSQQGTLLTALVFSTAERKVWATAAAPTTGEFTFAATAVCGTRNLGQHVIAFSSGQEASRPTKINVSRCDDGYVSTAFGTSLTSGVTGLRRSLILERLSGVPNQDNGAHVRVTADGTGGPWGNWKAAGNALCVRRHIPSLTDDEVHNPIDG